MANLADEIARFETALAVTPGAWRSLDVRSIAVRLGDEWHNVLTLVRLDPRDVEQLPADELLAETPSMLALRTRLPESARAALTAEVCAGRCAIQGRTIRYERDIRGVRAPYNYAYSGLATRLFDGTADADEAVGHQLGVSGDNMSTVIDTLRGGTALIDEELRAAEEPWDGLVALLEYGLGWSRKVNELAAQFLVSAPLATRIHSATGRLVNGRVSVAVETANQALAPLCSIGYVARTDGAMRARGTWRAPNARDWIPKENRQLWVLDRQVEFSDAPPHDVQIFLRVGPFVVDRLGLVDERRRVRHVLRTAYLTLDEEMRFLSSALLQPRRGDQVEFERAVARALLFAGFIVDSYAGDSRLSDAVDILAHDPEHQLLLVVECTTGPLQSRGGKLSRLAARARAVSAALRAPGDADSATRVIAVMATSLARSELGQWDQAGAEADEIVVMDNGALAQLLAVARGGQGTGAVLRLLQERTGSLKGLAALLGTWTWR